MLFLGLIKYDDCHRVVDQAQAVSNRERVRLLILFPRSDRDGGFGVDTDGKGFHDDCVAGNRPLLPSFGIKT